MRSEIVVVCHPNISGFLSLWDSIRQIGIEHFIPVVSVELFKKRFWFSFPGCMNSNSMPISFANSMNASDVISGPLSTRITLGTPYASINWFMFLSRHADGIGVPLSMRKASWLLSSITLRVLKGLLSYSVSRMKSKAHTTLTSVAMPSGCRSRVMTRFLCAAEGWASCRNTPYAFSYGFESYHPCACAWRISGNPSRNADQWFRSECRSLAHLWLPSPSCVCTKQTARNTRSCKLCSERVGGLTPMTRSPHARLSALEFYPENILDGSVLQRQLRIHAF